MEKQLIIIVCYVNFVDYNDRHLVAQRFAALKKNAEKLMPSLPDDMRERYFISVFFMATGGENRIECIFPKDPDADVMAKIDELINKQNITDKWLQQQLTKE